MAIRTIDLNIFPINKTVYKLLEEEKDRKKRIDDEVREWQTTRFPSSQNALFVKPFLLNSITAYDKCLTYFNAYNVETKLLEPATADAKKQIADLFKVNDTDTELIKLLKEIANDEEPKVLLEAEFEDNPGGMMWIVFVLETFKTFYLDYLPKHINEKLDIAEPVKLEEVKEQLKPILTDLYSQLYSSFDKLETESSLDNLKSNTNNNLENIKKVIYDYRNSKKKPVEPPKPTEDIEALKTKITNLEKLLTDKDDIIKSYDAYIDAVLEKQSQQPVYILTEEPEEIKPKESDRIIQ